MVSMYILSSLPYFSHKKPFCALGTWDLGLPLFFSGRFFLYTREGTASAVPCLEVLHQACSILMDMHSVDFGASLSRRVCAALEFCTVCVEHVCSFFFAFLSLQGSQRIGFSQWRWLEPGPLCPCHVGAWKPLLRVLQTVLVSGCAPRGLLFLHMSKHATAGTFL